MNNGNTCSDLKVLSITTDKPVFHMYELQFELQRRMNTLLAVDTCPTVRAQHVIFWRHCAQTEADELVEWLEAAACDRSQVDWLEVEMELVDILHFVFNMGIFAGLESFEVDGALKHVLWPTDLGTPQNIILGLQRVSQAASRFIDTLPWKTWKTYKTTEVSRMLLLDRFAILTTELLLVAGMLGMNKQRVLDVYCTKNAENHARQDRGY